MGEEWPSPGIFACQAMFSPCSTFHWVGAAEFVSSPLACGPRNCGQLAAERLRATREWSRSSVDFMRFLSRPMLMRLWERAVGSRAISIWGQFVCEPRDDRQVNRVCGSDFDIAAKTS